MMIFHLPAYFLQGKFWRNLADVSPGAVSGIDAAQEVPPGPQNGGLVTGSPHPPGNQHEPTYPTNGKGNSSSQLPNWMGYFSVPRRVYDITTGDARSGG